MKKVREGLESSLKSRIELIESYARVCFLLLETFTKVEPKKSNKFSLFAHMSCQCVLILCIFQISSMIEIEVEMDSDVLAAEAASNVVCIPFLVFLCTLIFFTTPI